MKDFQKELEQLINRHSKENGSDTPDFILAEYLVQCLNNFNIATSLRNKWYGGDKKNGNLISPKLVSIVPDGNPKFTKEKELPAVVRTFELYESEQKKYDAWVKKLPKKYKEISTEWIFCGSSGIGMSIKARKGDKEINLTDYGTW